jgi:hypothetical protein
VAYRDVLYETIYPSAGGRPVEPRHEFVRRIFEPLARQRIEVNDGFASGASCEGASIHVRAAEALLPYPPR